MELINDIVHWATYNHDAAVILSGLIGAATWSAGYVCVSELRRYYRTGREEREHIKPLDK